MAGLKDFYDRQYAELASQKTQSLDHPLYRFLLPFARTREEEICRLLGDEKFGKVVELGCGKCGIASQKIGNFDQFTGIDISTFQLNNVPAEVKSNPRVTLRTGDLNELFPFPDRSFGLAITASVIQYVFDPYFFLKEIHRILSPQGILILQTENLAFLPRRLQLAAGKLPTFNRAPGWQGGILHHFTFPAMKHLIAESGFEILTIRCAGLFPRARMLWSNLLAGDMIFKCKKAGN